MKNLKKILSLFLVSIMVLNIYGCSNQTSNSNAEINAQIEETKKTHIVVDHSGKEVEVPNEINRIVVLDIFPLPSVLSIFFDSADKLVGMAPASYVAAKESILSEIYPEILNAKTNFISGTNINTEEIIKLEPDIIFYGQGSKEIENQLSKLDIPSISISVNKWNYDAIETLNNWISLLSDIFPSNNKTDIVKKYSNDIKSVIDSRVRNLKDEEKEKAFFVFQYSDSNLSTSGKKFFGSYWANSVGAKNVGDELINDNSIPVNMEQVYAWDPSIIFITNFNTTVPNDLYENTIGNYDWSEITAVKNKRVYKTPLGMYRSYTPGVDTPVTLLWYAKTTYPQLFEDYDIIEETRKYYKQVFNIDLTDEQANKIFNPSVNVGDIVVR